MNSRPTSNAIRYAAITVALCLMVTAGVGTLAGFFGRSGWVYELASHFRVQYFWLLTLATTILVLAKARRWALAGAALAGVNLSLIVPLYVGPARPDTSGPKVRAMSLNVYYRNNQVERVLELIDDQRPDFMLLLEVTPEWAAALADIRGDYPFQRVLPQQDSGGIAFCSRLEARLETTVLGGKPAIIAHLVSRGGPLTVIGIHPSSPRNPRTFEDRNDELTALAYIASREHGPLVVMGDLNTTSWSPYFDDLVRVSGLVDSRRGFGVCATWPDLPMPGRIPIDHCLVSPDVAVLSRRVGPSVGSDHRAILIDLALPKQDK